jgi:hypothetical protein
MFKKKLEVLRVSNVRSQEEKEELSKKVKRSNAISGTLCPDSMEDAEHHSRYV